jgi:DNA-binding beta-propeller fold protein YncE
VAGEVVYTGTNFGNLYAITGDGSYATMVGAGLIEPRVTDELASPVVSATFDPTAIELVWQSGDDAQLTDGLCDVEISPLDGRMYAVDCLGHAIVIFAPDGTFLERWDDFGTEAGQFRFEYPGSLGWDGSIDFDADGNIYVFDSQNHRVQKFSPDRTFITMWGEFGHDEGQFDTPYGVIDRANGRVYVSELGNNRVQIFDLERFSKVSSCW